MKRLVSIALTLVMCFVLGVPAFAADAPADLVLVAVDSELSEKGMLIEVNELTDDHAANTETAAPDENQPVDDIELYGRGSSVAPTYVAVYPLLVVPEQDNQIFRVDSLGIATNLSGTQQAEYFDLSTQNTTQYLALINNAVAKYNADNGYTAAFIGWYLTCKINMVSNRPQSLVLTPSATSLTGTDPIEVEIPSYLTNAQYTVHGMFGFSNTDMTAYQSCGFTGGFYFKYDDGRDGSLYVGTGLCINSKN